MNELTNHKLKRKQKQTNKQTTSKEDSQFSRIYIILYFITLGRFGFIFLMLDMVHSDF